MQRVVYLVYIVKSICMYCDDVFAVGLSQLQMNLHK